MNAPPNAQIAVIGQIVVSLVVLGAFFGLTALIILRAVPAGNDDVAKVAFGAMATMSIAVVGFWIGSTISGSRKDDTIREQSGMLANSTPYSGPGGHL